MPCTVQDFGCSVPGCATQVVGIGKRVCIWSDGRKTETHNLRVSGRIDQYIRLPIPVSTGCGEVCSSTHSFEIPMDHIT